MANHTYHYFGAYLEIKLRESAKDHIASLLPPKYEDVLMEITPPDIYGTGVILARDNSSTNNSMWLFLSPWSGEYNQSVFPFPTDAEVEAMKESLSKTHVEIIELLREHQAVVSVNIKSGYVYCP